MTVTVVGAGVIGLMSAHALVHHGHGVRIVARELGEETTSARAAASFKPSGVGRTGPYRQLLVDSRRELDRWTAEGFAAHLGITEVRHVEASDRPVGTRDYLDAMRDVRHLDAGRGDDLPGGYAHALAYRTYFFDVPVTLAALVTHLTGDHGVELQRTMLADLTEATSGAGPQVVVNATGLGARALADDAAVVPVRGQTVLVPSSGLLQSSISADGAYAYPRADGIVLGGTAERGVWKATTERSAIERILAANERVLPGVSGTVPLATRAGLRPYRRGGVRLELEWRGRLPVVHAYGHGGSGWTLGPGTAAHVARIVDAVRTPSVRTSSEGR